MGRSYSKDLYELIHSLSKSEKRYFKLRSGQFNTDPDYVELFDMIARQKEFNDEKLLKQLKLKKKEKNLAFKKQHLYSLILDALEGFHKSNRTELQLLSLLSQIEITYNKGLYRHTEKLIDKGLALSRKHFRFTYELLFTQRKRDLVNHLQNSKIKEDMSVAMAQEVVKELEDEEAQLIDMMQIESISSRIYTKSTLVVRFGLFAEIPAIIEETRAFRDKYEMEKLPFSTQMKIQRAETIIMFANKDYQAQRKIISESIQLFQKHPEMIEEFKQEYLLHLNNMLVASIQEMDFDDCPYYLDLLKDYADPENKGSSQIEKTRAYAFYQYNQMKYYNTKGEYKKTIESFDRERFEKSGLDLNTYKRSQIILEKCIAWLFLDRYRDVIRIANETLQSYENFQPEVLSQIRVVYYIGHFMRKNLETLEQINASTDSRTITWFDDYKQEREFLNMLLSLGKDENQPKKLHEFCADYPVKVNPHFKYYLSTWVQNNLN